MAKQHGAGTTLSQAGYVAFRVVGLHILVGLGSKLALFQLFGVLV